MSKAVRVGAVALGGLVAVLSMTGCDVSFGNKKADAPSVPTPVAASASASESADAGKKGGPTKSASASAPGSKTGNGNGNGGHNGGGAQIVSFEIVQQPRCASGTTAYETPAVPLKIKWKVTGATGVALSVDDPHRVGSYGTYGPEETMEFTFSCGGAVGSTETHKYTIYTTGGSGEPKSKTLTVSTKVLEKGTKV
ncbi:hypothetical protein GCM10009557_62560 [Virgisporangium ochraceum]|uniref:Lipoprotein n=1 Tax=Virgisporangium ochraceum TaxID=65505 RepID=A0A8J3ZQ92_9ACTN|nr:hypothetical protein [Virgisporangium ochraceum]GIJ65570.1 hypothetical protein Voc01_004870 [Virgisporangium ochraceum]